MWGGLIPTERPWRPRCEMQVQSAEYSTSHRSQKLNHRVAINLYSFFWICVKLEALYWSCNAAPYTFWCLRTTKELVVKVMKCIVAVGECVHCPHGSYRMWFLSPPSYVRCMLHSSLLECSFRSCSAWFTTATVFYSIKSGRQLLTWADASRLFRSLKRCSHTISPAAKLSTSKAFNNADMLSPVWLDGSCWVFFSPPTHD